MPSGATLHPQRRRRAKKRKTKVGGKRVLGKSFFLQSNPHLEYLHNKTILSNHWVSESPPNMAESKDNIINCTNLTLQVEEV